MPLRKKIHNIKDQSNPPKFLNSLLRMSTPQRLYVLELQHGKYYVGITNNLQRRFQQHLDGTGSAWTREHAPVAVHITTALEGPLHEDRVTKEMMLEHGIDNVRGGAYCKVQLDEEQHAALTTEMRSASGVCLMCLQLLKVRMDVASFLTQVQHDRCWGVQTETAGTRDRRPTEAVR